MTRYTARLRELAATAKQAEHAAALALMNADIAETRAEFSKAARAWTAYADHVAVREPLIADLFRAQARKAERAADNVLWNA